jgi:hypothetical protein
MISVSTLILRSEVERLNTRRVERAFMQMESLVGELDNRENVAISTDDVRSRIQDLFLASPMQPVWVTKKFYAKVLMSLALTSVRYSLLDINVVESRKPLEFLSQSVIGRVSSSAIQYSA